MFDLQQITMDGTLSDMFRVQDSGNIVNLKDLTPFETSERLEGLEWTLDAEHSGYIIDGWRFTCGKWPLGDPVSVQQRVKLEVYIYEMASTVLASLLTCASYPDVTRDLEREKLKRMWVPAKTPVHVRLCEKPVEGAGLRVHLRGFKGRMKQHA